MAAAAFFIVRAREVTSLEFLSVLSQRNLQLLAPRAWSQSQRGALTTLLWYLLLLEKACEGSGVAKDQMSSPDIHICVCYGTSASQREEFVQEVSQRICGDVSGSTGYSKAAPWSTVPAQSTLYLIYNDDWHLGERRNHVREPCVF